MLLTRGYPYLTFKFWSRRKIWRHVAIASHENHEKDPKYAHLAPRKTDLTLKTHICLVSYHSLTLNTRNDHLFAGQHMPARSKCGICQTTSKSEKRSLSKEARELWPQLFQGPATEEPICGSCRQILLTGDRQVLLYCCGLCVCVCLQVCVCV